MEYIDVEWLHQDSNEPVRLVSELDHRRYEIRKLEFFSGGKVGFASQDRNSPGTELGNAEVPSLTEINESLEFNGISISSQTFEILWAAHAVPAA
ncbi:MULTISPECIES: DUF6881 domain-containing protein [Xanthomonas]|uniref:DUF6881 domain-containing protein n=1 Tax=Xanthomonas TaxID=338 RepID=UPI0006F5C474|nr:MULTISPECIES: hypothetical protein [Xanthomonas]KQR11646.1 hypothetical protein ASF90_13455 [Xanthomonas sp. Leaf148]